MTTEQLPEDVGGPLGWEPAGGDSEVLGGRWGAAKKPKERTPEEFQREVLRYHRVIVLTGELAGITLGAVARENSIRILAEHAVKPSERPGHRLPPSLVRLSAETKKLLERCVWSGFNGPANEAPLERIIAAVAALRVVRDRLELPQPYRSEWLPVGDSPIEAELCRELVASRAWLFGEGGRVAA